jgi:hypothetical protein
MWHPLVTQTRGDTAMQEYGELGEQKGHIMEENQGIDYKALYSQAWNQYNVYFQAYSIYNDKFNTIGAISAIFILVLTTAAQVWSKWFYLPIGSLLFPFFVALKNIMYRDVEIPWFGKEKLENQILEGDNQFFKCQVDDIFHAAGTLFKYKLFARRWISISVWFIIVSAIITFISLLVSLLPLVCSLYAGKTAT